MSHPTAWDADGLRAKASVYFERAFAADPTDPVFAFWCHLALEQLARAAVAHVSPALLAIPHKRESLLYGLGHAEADVNELAIESAPSTAVYDLCVRFVPDFATAERATCEAARQRRNAELHSALAAMEDLPRGWLGRFFAACRVLVRHLGLELDDVLSSDDVELVDRLIVEDKAEIAHQVRNAIDEARARVAELAASERQRREELAAAELNPRPNPLGVSPFAAATMQVPKPRPRKLREVPCPVCKTTVALRGEAVTRGVVQVDADGDLTERQVAVPTMLRCEVCELKLDGVAELTVVGLAEPVTLIDYPDPVETFGVDINDYRDEFLQSLADDYEYQDE